MTKAQQRLYLFGDQRRGIVGWLKVRETLIRLGGDSPKEADAKRQEIHEEALGLAAKDRSGEYRSSKTFTNKELDRVLDTFAKYVIGAQAPQLAVNEPVKRAIKGIEMAASHAGFAESYIEAIARDKFACDDWRTLTELQLRDLKRTIDARGRSKARKAAPE